MFRRPTVFILGAGASWHYGYPTGEELVRKITEKAAVLRDFLNDRITPAPKYVQRKIADTSSEGLAVGYSAAVNECANLLGRLQSSNPLVIDYFLGHNEHLSDIGRFLIAWVILERESEFERPGRINPNRTRDEIAKGGHHKDDCTGLFCIS